MDLTDRLKPGLQPAANLAQLSQRSDAEQPPFPDAASPDAQLRSQRVRYAPPRFRASDPRAETERSSRRADDSATGE